MVKFLVFIAGLVSGHLMTRSRLGISADVYHKVLVGEAEVKVQDVVGDGKAEGI